MLIEDRPIPLAVTMPLSPSKLQKNHSVSTGSTPISSQAFMNGILTAMCLTPSQQSSQMPTHPPPPSPLMPPTGNFLQTALKMSSPSPQLVATDMTMTTNAVTPTTAASTSSSSSCAPNEHGEMDEASLVGTSVTGWRDPAPYRCGHCHQVSNWKHVIQVFY